VDLDRQTLRRFNQRKRADLSHSPEGWL
jgi:hypothetical protein